MNRLFLIPRLGLTYLGALATALICIVFGPFDRSKKILLKFCHYFAKIFLPVMGIGVWVRGAEKIDRGENYILCANHQGLFDIFSLMSGIDLPLRFVSKPSYFKIPIIGGGMRGAGHIEVTRTDRVKDRQTLDALVRLVRNGATIVMFPEGTRTRDGRVGPFKYGAFYVSVHSGIPILPITIEGSFERWKKGERLPNPGTIHITVHDPIEPSGWEIEDLKEETRRQISDRILSK